MNKQYTVKQIANTLNVSKPTVQKAINEKNIKAARIEKNKYRYYDVEQLKEVITAIKPDFDFSNLSQNTENTENDRQETENIIDKPQENRQVSQTLLEMLQAEIEKKDKELEKKDLQIENLQNKLDKAYEQITDLAQKAQYITAADKTSQLIEQQQKNDDSKAAAEEVQNQVDLQEPPKKRRWFKLFKN